ncbi:MULTISPECIES: N-acetyl-1-D-myo-inositol-2-amino-2-deoxy-alpha-D-glucopyranoside deacetylase [unclassified Corynebacterium]|uniref:N-acetyl-1-D-myo-inositol-2-amino-2-deoxy-alpha- D-glucopyranoside deacetylase n=1 Tax=unclassified Corynebacterium TaxID=2624378 RepID=UPI0029CA767C|nr:MULTISPECIES: N-acetyl-1-D-myo-inositol-2-amino-2-deoxy-alpha-D-glucopyranoside deacetylase [unclassified Corynebacterium]WPF66953.1 N-acetyl-1-D-myo-inositol-2-amino-2-deoxy-alpha-D-glucopyranoside deacetylase [Corynebacterium sp. 22KM0430]WPF69441.1 N-acetyl-1-D-myo-inositol-2-amino-2-deoxy-alpha-D-glucopyranoside deacetylase [Corynebacterium sp. 21KM1197]
MTRNLRGKSVVAVHAHPDDEAIWTGGALARLAGLGAEVTVVTCTLGEQGEVIGEPYAHLVAERADQLGGFRIAEWRESLERLGVRGVFLGGAGKYRDSGMAGTPAAEHPRAFASSGEEAVVDLAGIFERLRPDLVLTYGPDGGYGHPDHIRAHEITHAAVQKVWGALAESRPDSAPVVSEPAGERRAEVPGILWAVTLESELQAGLGAIESIPQGWRRARPGEIACVPEADLAIEMTPGEAAAKIAAMRAHATQLWLADGSVSATNPHAAYATLRHPGPAAGVFALSNLIAQPVTWREHYAVGQGSAEIDGERWWEVRPGE